MATRFKCGYKKRIQNAFETVAYSKWRIINKWPLLTSQLKVYHVIICLQSSKSSYNMFWRTSPGAIGCLKAAMSSSWISISSSSASTPPSVSYWLSPSPFKPLLFTAGMIDLRLPAPFRRSSTNVPIVIGILPFNSPPFWSISSRNWSTKKSNAIFIAYWSSNRRYRCKSIYIYGPHDKASLCRPSSCNCRR